MEPSVSVIIPAYNVESYIEQCLDSILAQTLRDFELIVVDDGSTDATADILQRYASRDERVSVVQQQNKFAGAARNAGMERAHGKYLSFIDADDFVEPHFFEKMVARAEKTCADVVVCKSSYYNDATHDISLISNSLLIDDLESVVSGMDLCDSVFQSFVGWPWDKLYRADFVREHSLKFQEIRSTNDALFVFMALIFAQKIAFVSESLVLHRIGNNASISNTRHFSWQCAQGAVDKIEECLREAGLFDAFERSFDNWLADFLIWNYTSLPASVRPMVYKEMLARMESLAKKEEGYITVPFNADAVSVFEMDREQLIDAALVAKKELQSKTWENEGLLDYNENLKAALAYREKCFDDECAQHARDCEELTRRCDELNEFCKQLTDERDDWYHQLELVKESKSYKIGRALTGAPRRVRDTLHPARDD
jgi:glycosyltransferase involved in cell wall biosynthesis